ncbi:MAG: MarR family winged helix-turn-helix transcriptional regulator [Ideonella sp.]
MTKPKPASPAMFDASGSDATDDDKLQLGPLNDLLGYHLAHAVFTTSVMFERHIGTPFQLSKIEYSMLMLILSNGPLAPKRLAHALALTAPKMSMLLDRMQSRGLLRRERSEIDRRSQNVVLTPEGDRIANRSAAAAVSAEAALSSRLSRAERAMLVELLSKVAGR